MKLFEDYKSNVHQINISISERVENTVGKGENAGYQAFSPFPTVFSTAVFFGVVKNRNCVVKN